MKHSSYELTLLEIIGGLLVFLLFFLFYPAINGYDESEIYKVKSDQRYLAISLEAYYVDQGAYPSDIDYNKDIIVSYLGKPMIDRYKFKHYNNNLSLLWGEYGVFILLGFLGMILLSIVVKIRKPDYWDFEKVLSGILIPCIIFICLLIAFLYGTRRNFIGRYKILPDWQGKDLGMCYYSDRNGWIVISVGPDGDYDIDPTKYYNSEVPQPSFELLCLAGTYDPTNGTFSNGDVYRVKQ